MGHGVKLTEIVEKMDLKNLTPKVELVDREVNVPDVNRPALQLVGFFDHFDSNRVQIIGNVEYNYLKTLTEETKTKVYHELLEYKLPCVIFSKSLQPDEISDPLAECETCSLHFYPWSSCRCVRCRCSDYGRERNRKE